MLSREVLASLRLAWESADLGRLLLLYEGEVGELWAERYRLLLDGLERIEGSDRPAMAVDVRSRANAASVNRVPRFCFEELVESVD